MNGTSIIRLTQGKYAIIDEEDFDRVVRYKWFARNSCGYWYAARNATPDCAERFLHRFVLNAPPGTLVDHVNGDGLDCRRANIRLATKRDNQRNSKKRRDGRASGFKGVRQHKLGYWMARIKVDGKEYAIYCRSEIEAAAAYNALAVQFFGEFARLNQGVLPCLPDRRCGIRGCAQPTLDPRRLNSRFCAQHSSLPDWKRSELCRDSSNAP